MVLDFAKFWSSGRAAMPSATVGFQVGGLGDFIGEAFWVGILDKPYKGHQYWLVQFVYGDRIDSFPEHLERW